MTFEEQLFYAFRNLAVGRTFTEDELVSSYSRTAHLSQTLNSTANLPFKLLEFSLSFIHLGELVSLERTRRIAMI